MAITTEEIVFGDVTTGPSNDLQVATNLAREMVTKYGMSNEIGPLVTVASQKVMFGNSFEGEISPAMQNRVDVEVERIMKESHSQAHELINKTAMC